MARITKFDVLIVYSETLARSASDMSSKNTTPFPYDSNNNAYNDVYGYFLDICRKLKLKAAFTTSADIVGPGCCKSYWLYKNHSWEKKHLPCYSSLIFDKFSPKRVGINCRRQLLFSHSGIKPFNSPELYELFFDKQKTFDTLSSYSIPSISLTGKTLKSVTTACTALAQLMSAHPKSNDFTSDLVMKDRFGAGGRHVYKFNKTDHKKMLSVIQQHSHVSFILQPFAKFDQGFKYRQVPASTDIRFIYLGPKLVQSYIRVATQGEFRCNEHQGGTLTYLLPADLPPSLVSLSDTIAQKLNQNNSLYALDFIISNNGNAYLLEGNTGPGLDWNQASPRNETEAKKLIRLIVGQLSLRSRVGVSLTGI